MNRAQKNFLLVDLPGFRPLPAELAALLSGRQPADLSCQPCVTAVTSVQVGQETLERGITFDYLLVNAPLRELFRTFRERCPRGRIFLWTNQSMPSYSAALGDQEEILVDHFIANVGPGPELVGELLRCLGVLETPTRPLGLADLLHLGSDLTPAKAQGRKVITHPIRGSQDRLAWNQAILEYAKSQHLATPLAKGIFGICEELLMNAIYDAPYAAGRRPSPHQPGDAVELAPAEWGQLAYAFDGQTFGISVEDPFGALTREKFFSYLKKVVKRHRGQAMVDDKKSGAGLGLFKILYHCHGLICQCSPGKFSRVIALVRPEIPLLDLEKMPRSIHYFELLANLENVR